MYMLDENKGCFQIFIDDDDDDDDECFIVLRYTGCAQNLSACAATYRVAANSDCVFVDSYSNRAATSVLPTRDRNATFVCKSVIVLWTKILVSRRLLA